MGIMQDYEIWASRRVGEQGRYLDSVAGEADAEQVAHDLSDRNQSVVVTVKTPEGQERHFVKGKKVVRKVAGFQSASVQPEYTLTEWRPRARRPVGFTLAA